MSNLNPLFKNVDNQIDKKLLFEYYYRIYVIDAYASYIEDIDHSKEIESLLKKLYNIQSKYFESLPALCNYNIDPIDLDKALKIYRSNPVFKKVYELGIRIPIVVNKAKKQAIQQVKIYFNKNNYRENYYTKENEKSTIEMAKNNQKDINSVISEYKKDFINCYKGIYVEEQNSNAQQLADKVKKDFKKLYPILISKFKEFIINHFKSKKIRNYVICTLGGSLICGFYSYSKQNGFVPDDNGMPCIRCGNVANYIIWLDDKKRNTPYPYVDYYDSPIFILDKGWQNGQWNIKKVL